MGSGLVSRYRAPKEEHNTWRQPKAPPKKGSAKAPGAKAKASPSDAAPQSAARHQPGGQDGRGAAGPVLPGTTSAAQAAERSAASWSTASAKRAPPPVPTVLSPDNDDEDLEEFDNLCDAANKVWEELLAKKENTKDFGALFIIGDMKDGVERAAKRVDILTQEASDAAAKEEERRLALEKACARIEEKSLAGSNASIDRWKLGDLAIRRGKGLCELSTVHHEADPPYYEVRMFVTGSLVGTESEKLMPLLPAQQSTVRAALKEFEQERDASTRAQDLLAHAQEELKQQHQRLTDQVEKKLKIQSDKSDRRSPTGGASLGASRTAPPGLPEMDLVRGWVGPPKAPAAPSVGIQGAQDYPDLRGLKEDLRRPVGDSIREDSAHGPSAGDTSTAPLQRAVTPNAPVGFPSLDALNKMEEEAAEKDRRQAAAAAAASNYPTAHAGAAREVFVRPSGADESSRGQRRSQQPQQGTEQASQQQPQVGSKTASSAPAGFPSMDTSFARSKDNSQVPSQHRPTYQKHTPQQQRQQGEPQADAYQQAYQQQQQYQQQQYQEAYQQQQQSPPVATDWVIYRTAEGVPYYHNERTTETAWQLPAGAACRQPGEPAAAGGASQQQQQQQQAAATDDPFAHLRQQEEDNKRQRDEWAAWYSNYCSWYQSQAGQAAPNSGAPRAGQAGAGGDGATGSNGAGNGASRKSQSFSGGNNAGASGPPPGAASGATSLPPKGPAPPTLDAGFEDNAVFAIKSSVLKEMEVMVNQGAPVAQRKKALRCLQIRWHPDKNPDRLEVAKSVFQFMEDTKPWFLHEQEESGG